jgi:small subunit ribosomal protein S17
MPRQTLRKTRVGVVVSTKMQKTAVVRVDRLVEHPLYQKTQKQSKKFHAHDEKGICAEGDVVKMMETRPVSKTKCWRVIEVVKKAS